VGICEKDTVKLEKEFFGEKSVIIAKSGYGKSYTARVIIEEGIKTGQTFIVIDPQDAYLNLPNFAYINAEDVKSAKGFAILLSQTNKNTVIRTKRLTIEDQNSFMYSFISEFRKNIRRGIQTIIIDEVHKFAPEGQKTASRDVIRGMFQENRSDGLGCIAITQRISRLDKTILSQADHLCIGKVTSHRDKEAVKNYIDNINDVETISKLEKGEFYCYGFGLKHPEVIKIRKSETEHSGTSPKNLLTEDIITYDNHIKKFVKSRGKNKMANEIKTSGETISKIIPSMDGFMDLAKLGAKVSIGGAIGGIAGAFLGSKFKSPIPMISSRTLGGAGTTIALYAGYRMIPIAMTKDLFKFASAGSAVFTLGSLTFDILTAFNIKLPNLANFALATATGANPAVAQSNKSESGSSVDVNTNFA